MMCSTFKHDDEKVRDVFSRVVNSVLALNTYFDATFGAYMTRDYIKPDTIYRTTTIQDEVCHDTIRTFLTAEQEIYGDMLPFSDYFHAFCHDYKHLLKNKDKIVEWYNINVPFMKMPEV